MREQGWTWGYLERFHCYNTFISALIVTPRYFSFTVIPRTISHILSLTSKFPFPVCRHLHYSKCYSIYHFSDHLTYNISCLVLFVNVVYHHRFKTLVVSSANISTLLVKLLSN